MAERNIFGRMADWLNEHGDEPFLAFAEQQDEEGKESFVWCLGSFIHTTTKKQPKMDVPVMVKQLNDMKDRKKKLIEVN